MKIKEKAFGRVGSMGRVGHRRMGMWAMGIGMGFRGISSLSIVVGAKTR